MSARLMAGAAWLYSLGPLTLRKVLRALDKAPLQAAHMSSQACCLNCTDSKLVQCQHLLVRAA